MVLFGGGSQDVGRAQVRILDLLVVEVGLGEQNGPFDAVPPCGFRPRRVSCASLRFCDSNPISSLRLSFLSFRSSSAYGRTLEGFGSSGFVIGKGATDAFIKTTGLDVDF